MEYSIHRFDKIEDCDKLLERARDLREKEALNLMSTKRRYEKNKLLYESSRKKIAEIKRILVVIEDFLRKVNDPDGDPYQLEKQRQLYKLERLTRQAAHYDGKLLLQMERAINERERRVTAADDFIAQIEARRAELAGQ